MKTIAIDGLSHSGRDTQANLLRMQLGRVDIARESIIPDLGETISENVYHSAIQTLLNFSSAIKSDLIYLKDHDLVILPQYVESLVIEFLPMLPVEKWCHFRSAIMEIAYEYLELPEPGLNFFLRMDYSSIQKICETRKGVVLGTDAVLATYQYQDAFREYLQSTGMTLIQCDENGVLFPAETIAENLRAEMVKSLQPKVLDYTLHELVDKWVSIGKEE